MNRHELIGMAHAILDMADDVSALKRQNEHLQALLDMYRESSQREMEMHQETFGGVLKALLDPDNAFAKSKKESKPIKNRSDP